MFVYVLIAIGGAIGSVARFWLSGVVSKNVGDSFPWGTIFVNVSGSLLIGILAALVGPNGKMEANARALTTHFLILGVCGGYTTFSSFSLQTFSMLQEKHYLAAGGNILLSTALCLFAVAAGFWIGTLMNPDRPL